MNSFRGSLWRRSMHAVARLSTDGPGGLLGSRRRNRWRTAASKRRDLKGARAFTVSHCQWAVMVTMGGGDKGRSSGSSGEGWRWLVVAGVPVVADPATP